MPPGKWPKDVHPQVIRRANEVTHLSRTEAIDILRASQRELNSHLQHRLIQRLLRDRFNTLPQQIAGDPVTNAIQGIANGIGDNADIILMLRMFVYLFHAADDLEMLLGTEPLLDRKRILLKEYCTVVSSRFSGRQIVDTNLLEFGLRNPPELTAMLKAGLAPIRAIWWTLDAQSRRKLVVDLLDSPKGYPKTARAAAEWRPASQVNLTHVTSEWLDTGSNTSVVTSMPTFIPTARQQIAAEYATATQDQRNTMWFTLFFHIGKALAVSNDKEALRAAVQGGVEELVAEFGGVVDAMEVRNVVAAFDTIWDTYM